MRYKPLPRYLRIAHWLHEQGRPVTSQEAATVFDSSLKTIREDFNKIRKLTDIIESHEHRAPHQDRFQYQLEVVHLHPYVLDEHQCPHRVNADGSRLDMSRIWQALRSRPWSQMVFECEVDANVMNESCP